MIGAGSLLEVALERARIPVPVGRVASFWLGPMTFSEFLRAGGHETELDLVETLTAGQRIAAPVHERLCRLQREFLFVGGMPEAVARFSTGGGSDAVAAIQQQLLDGFRDPDPCAWPGGAQAQVGVGQPRAPKP